MGIETSFTSFGANGVQVTSGAATASVALPVTSAGTAPKYVRVQSTGFAYIRFGGAAVTATTGDFLLSANNSEVISTGGSGFMAYLQETAAAKINITPLEA